MTGLTSQTPSPSSPEELRLLHARLMGRIHRRLIITGGLEGACLGLLIGALGIATMRTGHIPPSMWWVLLLLAIASTTAGALFRRFTGFQPSQDLHSLSRRGEDEHRLERAFELIDALSDPSHSATPFELQQAHQAFHSALERVQELDPQGDRAPAWRRPPDFFLVLMVVLALLAVGVMPLSDPEPSPSTTESSAIQPQPQEASDSPPAPGYQHHSFDIAHALEALEDAPEATYQLYPRMDHLVILYLLYQHHLTAADRSISPQ